MNENIIVIANTSDNAFGIDVAYHLHKKEDISDIIALKTFLNSEFCPRFINDEEALNNIGYRLQGKTIIITSTTAPTVSRNDLAMRNCIIARTAKDNGAEKVILLEPDLFYSCQDRGPQQQHYFHKEDKKNRSIYDRKKFDGQAFTSLLYAQLLKLSGIDQVFTVENHSDITKNIFQEHLNLQDIRPHEVFVHYLENSDILEENNCVLCAPDSGANEQVKNFASIFSHPNTPYVQMQKERKGERKIKISLSDESTILEKDLKGKSIIVVDDMVRTGTTIIKCCQYLKQFKPKRIIFCVTHFFSSPEIRENLSSPLVDEILTTNTIPSILNRDSQGRLRKKMIVLKIEKLIAKKIAQKLNIHTNIEQPLYAVDISSKNPRSRHTLP